YLLKDRPPTTADGLTEPKCEPKSKRHGHCRSPHTRGRQGGRSRSALDPQALDVARLAARTLCVDRDPFLTSAPNRTLDRDADLRVGSVDSPPDRKGVPWRQFPSGRAGR